MEKNGFTLIELLVVIAIIGLLSSVVLSSLNAARQKANNARRLSDMGQIRTALELYYNDNGKYPVVGWQSQCAGWGSVAGSNVIPGLVPTYLPTMPADPQMKASVNQYCYIYASYDSGANYKLLDYNLIGITVTNYPTFVDPARNYGQTRPPGCSSATETTNVFAIYSAAIPDAAPMCW